MAEAAPMGRYRLRATMTPLHGAPVNWNARAIIWSGADRRFWLRKGVRWGGRRIRPRRVIRVRSWRYRASMWLFRCIDDRDRTYTPWVARARRMLNTGADVEARKAWIATNMYWRARGRA